MWAVIVCLHPPLGELSLKSELKVQAKTLISDIKSSHRAQESVMKEIISHEKYMFLFLKAVFTQKIIPLKARCSTFFCASHFWAELSRESKQTSGGGDENRG